MLGKLRVKPQQLQVEIFLLCFYFSQPEYFLRKQQSTWGCWHLCRLCRQMVWVLPTITFTFLHMLAILPTNVWLSFYRFHSCIHKYLLFAAFLTIYLFSMLRPLQTLKIATFHLKLKYASSFFVDALNFFNGTHGREKKKLVTVVVSLNTIRKWWTRNC